MSGALLETRELDESEHDNLLVRRVAGNAREQRAAKG
jgi:hypothetical protein